MSAFAHNDGALLGHTNTKVIRESENVFAREVVGPVRAFEEFDDAGP